MMITNFQKIAHTRGADSFSQEQIRKINSQMTSCICNITQNNISGTGFFCKIPFPDSYYLLPVLITCNHVLDEGSICTGKSINFNLNEKSYSLFMDDSRKKYTNVIKDITFIEIKRNDNIKNVSFLDIDENIYINKLEDENSIYDEKYLYEDEKSVYVLHFEYGKDNKYSPGNILYIKKSKKGYYKIMYSCSTKQGSSGGPIINSSNYKVIGIHRGYERNCDLNLGMIIEVPNEFYNYYNKKRVDNLDNYYSNLIKYSEIHEHTFYFDEEINEQCNICLQKIEYTPGYKCDYCKIILCLDCTSKIFDEQKMKNLHHHPLNLTKKIKNWICDICSFNYSDQYISFFCHQCGFDACGFCYLDRNNKSIGLMIENNKSIHKHPLYYKKKLNTECSFCDKKIKNKPGYECKKCDIILCLSCDFIIFHKKTNFIHPHNLKLKNRIIWECNLCMKYYFFQASCCIQCDYDICYKCYNNSLKN